MQVAELPYTLGYVIKSVIENAVLKGLPVFISNSVGETYTPVGTIFLGEDHIRFTTIDEGKKTQRIIPLNAIAEVFSSLD